MKDTVGLLETLEKLRRLGHTVHKAKRYAQKKKNKRQRARGVDRSPLAMCRRLEYKFLRRDTHIEHVRMELQLRSRPHQTENAQWTNMVNILKKLEKDKVTFTPRSD